MDLSDVVAWSAIFVGIGIVIRLGWQAHYRRERRKTDELLGQIIDLVRGREWVWRNHKKIRLLADASPQGAVPEAVVASLSEWLLVCTDVIVAAPSKAVIPRSAFAGVEVVELGETTPKAVVCYVRAAKTAAEFPRVVYADDKHLVALLGDVRTSTEHSVSKLPAIRRWPRELRLATLVKGLPPEHELSVAAIYGQRKDILSGEYRKSVLAERARLRRQELEPVWVDIQAIPKMRRFKKGRDLTMSCRGCTANWQLPSDILNAWLEQGSLSGKLQRTGTKMQHVGNLMTPGIGWAMAGGTGRRIDTTKQLDLSVQGAVRCPGCGAQSIAVATQK